jgi:Skp family chaperone for outer membrane proteins
MKKFALLSILLLFSTNFSFAENNIAVVDLQQLVSNSNEVKQLKEEHTKKMNELDKLIVNARGEISNETDPAKILQLEDKYTKEFNSKKDELERIYNTKLSSIEKHIKDEILKKAEKDNYDYIFAKSVVLYGGKDITNELTKSIK